MITVIQAFFLHNQDNVANRCVSTCQPKLATGEDCWNEKDYSYISGKCRGCNKCADGSGRLPNNFHCYTDTNCQHGSYCSGSNTNHISCIKGTCKPKLADGQRFTEGDGARSCQADNTHCKYCGHSGVVPRGQR